MAAPPAAIQHDAARPATSLRDARLCRAMTGTTAAYCALGTIVVAIVLARVSLGTWLQPDQVEQLFIAVCIHAGAAAVFYFGWRRCGRRVAVSRRHAQIVLLSCSLAALLSLDRIAAIAYPPPSRIQGVCQPHPVRGWAHRPGVYGLFETHPDRVNALGMRGPEISKYKPNDQTRVLVLGDSIAVGYLLPRGDTPVDHLNVAARLRHPTSDTLFMNGACAGYMTWQQFDFLRNEGMKTKPDVMVLVYCINDMLELIDLPEGAISGVPDPEPAPRINYPSGLVRAATTIFDDWRLARIRHRHLWVRRDPLANPDNGLDLPQHYYEQPPRPAVARAWERACRELDAVNEFCQQKKLPWILVAFPTTQMLDGEVSIDGFAPLQAWAEASAVAYHDLAIDFARALAGQPAGNLFMDPIHPNKEGSRLMANVLVEVMAKRGLIGGVSGN